MQVSVEATTGLERRMTVRVPREEVDQKVEQRLRSLATGLRINGFRPGKVPYRIVQQRFGGQVRQEVVGELIQASFSQALAQEGLHPVGQSSIEPMEASEDLKYTAVFEVYPEIEIAPLTTAQVRRPVVEITEDDVGEMIETLRRQRASWIPVDRPAHDGDRVEITYRGTVDGKDFAGGQADHVGLVLGSGTMIQGLEEGLRGARPGDEVDLHLVFPTQYPVAALAGRPVEFHVEVHTISESELAAIDAEFIRSFGVASGDEGEFRRNVRENMERELERIVHDRVRHQVIEQLLEVHDPAIPKALLQEELGRVNDRVKQQGAEGAIDEAATRELEDQARRRVKLGLLLGEVIRANGIEADPAKVRHRIEAIAASYDEPQQVVSWYMGNPEQRAAVETVVVEQSAIEWLLEQMQVVDEPSTFSELVRHRRGRHLGEETSASATVGERAAW